MYIDGGERVAREVATARALETRYGDTRNAVCVLASAVALADKYSDTVSDSLALPTARAVANMYVGSTRVARVLATALLVVDISIGVKPMVYAVARATAYTTSPEYACTSPACQIPEASWNCTIAVKLFVVATISPSGRIAI